MIRPLKRRLHRAFLNWCHDGRSIKTLTARAHFEGMRFHEAEVRKYSALLKWVTRADDFDYTLPDGWERWKEKT